ncbi:MAG: hypothetical protein MUO95_01505, partial [Methanoregula sp.]|nr:hypothetical protein [Methanoregula sp.]
DGGPPAGICYTSRVLFGNRGGKAHASWCCYRCFSLLFLNVLFGSGNPSSKPELCCIIMKKIPAQPSDETILGPKTLISIPAGGG